MAVTEEQVATWLGLSWPTQVVHDDARLTACLAAVIANVRQTCTIPVDDDDLEVWPDDLSQAVVMATARLFRRKDTPEGVASFPELGVITVRSYDPDVEQMLAPYRTFGFA